MGHFPNSDPRRFQYREPTLEGGRGSDRACQMVEVVVLSRSENRLSPTHFRINWRLRWESEYWFPLGPRRLTAYVVGHPESPPDGVKIRPVLDILDQQPIFGPELLALCQWASRYYHESLGEMLSTALPGGINQQDARMVCAGKIPSPEVLDEDPFASALRVLEGGEQRLQTFLKTLKCGVCPILRWERDGWVGLELCAEKRLCTGKDISHSRFCR